MNPENNGLCGCHTAHPARSPQGRSFTREGSSWSASGSGYANIFYAIGYIGVTPEVSVYYSDRSQSLIFLMALTHS